MYVSIYQFTDQERNTIESLFSDLLCQLPPSVGPVDILAGWEDGKAYAKLTTKGGVIEKKEIPHWNKNATR